MKDYRLTYYDYQGYGELTRDTKEECLEEARQIAKAGCMPSELMKYDSRIDRYKVIGNFTKKV